MIGRAVLDQERPRRADRPTRDSDASRLLFWPRTRAGQSRAADGAERNVRLHSPPLPITLRGSQRKGWLAGGWLGLAVLVCSPPFSHSRRPPASLSLRGQRNLLHARSRGRASAAMSSVRRAMYVRACTPYVPCLLQRRRRQDRHALQKCLDSSRRDGQSACSTSRRTHARTHAAFL